MVESWTAFEAELRNLTSFLNGMVEGAGGRGLASEFNNRALGEVGDQLHELAARVMALSNEEFEAIEAFREELERNRNL